jgi:hypothetical protein
MLRSSRLRAGMTIDKTCKERNGFKKVAKQ